MKSFNITGTCRPNELRRYLEYFDLQQGYLLSFCFNKNKTSGLLPPVVIGGRTLIEAIV